MHNWTNMNEKNVTLDIPNCSMKTRMLLSYPSGTRDKDNVFIGDPVLFSRPTLRPGFGDRFDDMLGDEINSDPTGMKLTANLRPSKCGEVAS
jgi:hypothetical protein